MAEQRDGRGVYVFPKTKAPMNTVTHNNRFSNMDFDELYRGGAPYEYEEFPKAVETPIPSDDELPPELQRKSRETTDSNGQLHTWVEPEKFWRKRVERLWPNHYPIAQNAAEEAALRGGAKKAKAS